MNSIVDMLAEDREVIAYRPKLRAIAGSALGAILLQQILHRAKNNHWKPFWKFTAPCGNEDCRPGDSWLEELGFTESEFSLARDAIATKISTGMKKSDLLNEVLVFYWTDSTRKTWYEVNRPLLSALLDELYTEDSAKPLIAVYIENRSKHITRKRRLSGLYITSETSETSKNSGTEDVPEPSLKEELPEEEPEREVLPQSTPANVPANGKIANLPASIRNSIEHPAQPKVLPPTTPMARYLAAQATYGNRSWNGFASAGERDDWLKMEQEFDQADIRGAIDWACGQKRFGKAKLVHNIITAVNNRKESTPKKKTWDDIPTYQGE